MQFKSMLESLQSQYRFEVLSLDGAEMVTGSLLKIDGKTLDLDEVSWKRFATFLGFSVKTLERGSEDLKKNTFNYYLESGQGGDVVVQYYGDEIESFYRTDHPLVPVLDSLESIGGVLDYSGEPLSHYKVSSQRRGYSDTVVDLVKGQRLWGFETSGVGYQVHLGVRVTINFDPEVSSQVEGLLEFVSPENTFKMCIELPNKGKVRPKGKTQSEIVDSFVEVASGWVKEIDQTLGMLYTLEEVLSETDPKLNVMVTEMGVSRTVQNRVMERLYVENPWLKEKASVSEIEAIVALGVFVRGLVSSANKVERYLGSLFSQGGDRVVVCKCCGQRVTQTQEKNNGTGS